MFFPLLSPSKLLVLIVSLEFGLVCSRISTLFCILSWAFRRFDSKHKFKHKTNLSFFIFVLFYSPHMFTLFIKMPLIFFFFLKLVFLLSQPHYLQVFTRLSLPSIPQPPRTTNLKLLMHLKSIYTLPFSLVMN